MAKNILRTQDGKKVVIDVSKDATLYRCPVNPPGSGTSGFTGTDLLAHKARSGNVYFYFHHWSMWQGSVDSFSLIDRNAAEEFLIEKAGISGQYGLDEREIEFAKEFGFDLMEETA